VSRRLQDNLGAIIVAAGRGTRFGDADKVFAQLGGRPVLEYALRLIATQRDITVAVLVLGEHNLARGAELVAALGLRDGIVCAGGATRSDSVRAGLGRLDPDVEIVAIHDAARPLASPALLRRLLDAGHATGAAVPAIPVADTIQVMTESGQVEALLDRGRLRAIQTPQVFRRDWLERAFAANPGATTDEGSLLHAAGYPVTSVLGEPHNYKLTTRNDLVVAEALLAARAVAP
jgi:2-C-methyl-D-erythritol 4-phosphate cytidylyltransferase